MKKIDLFLLIVILVALALIGQQFFNGGFGSSTEQAADGQIPAQSNVSNVQTSDLNAQQGPFWILSKVKKLSDTDWKTAVQSAGKFGRPVDVSDGCRGGAVASRTSINHIVHEYARGMAAADFNVMIGVIGEEACHRIGDPVLSLSFDPSPDRPLVENLGSIKIKGILMVMPQATTEDFLSILGPTRRDYFAYMDMVRRRLDRPDTVLYFESGPAQQMDLSVAPPTFPMTRVLKYPDAKAALEQGSAVLVDVRSPEEFPKASSEKVMNVPYSVSRMPKSNALFAEKKSEFGRTDFEISKLLTKDVQDKTVIVVGKGPSDVRPVLALYELRAAGFRKVAWIHEGAPAQYEAIK